MNDLERIDISANICNDCGGIVLEGDWPFCASPANPEGHAKGAYGFRMRMDMKTNGWSRSKR